MNNQLLQSFSAWADRVLSQNTGASSAAYCFNLYEHAESFVVQLVGAREYDPADPDWPTNEAFSSGEDLFEIPRDLVGDDWRDGVEAAKSLVSNFLRVGRLAARLTSARAVAVGFVDGDLEIVPAPADA